MKSRLLAGVAAVVLAVAGASLVANYAQGADTRAMQGLEPVTVMVVTKTVPAGTPAAVLAGSVTAQQLPAKAVAKTALRNLDGVADRVAAVDLLPGEQLIDERLIAPADLESSGLVPVPEGFQEISFQLEPQRVVGGRVEAGDHVGIFISLKGGGIEAKPEKETTQLTLHKVLVTAVAGAPAPAAAPEPEAGPAAATAKGTAPLKTVLAPTAPILLTVAVNDVDAARIVYAAEFGSLWLSREPLSATHSGAHPGIITKPEVYK